MSGMLYGVGAIAVVVGVVMVGFGIPVNEFSFGNTLIGAGTTAAVGGLIVIGLGVVVAQLQRIHEALATRAPIKSSRQFDTFETAGRNAPAWPIPFPPRPSGRRNSRAATFRAAHGNAVHRYPADEPRAAVPAPTLRNPEEPRLVEDDVSLSPPHPMAPGPRTAAGRPGRGPIRAETRCRRACHRHRLRPRQRGRRSDLFTMWPASPSRQGPRDRPELVGTKPGGKLPPRRAGAPIPPTDAAPASGPRRRDLKSGVVDGMGYTLYVDGSIEPNCAGNVALWLDQQFTSKKL